MSGFLLLVGDEPQVAAVQARHLDRSTADPPLTLRARHSGVRLYAQDPLPVTPFREQSGFIIGRWFRRAPTPRSTPITDAETSAILATQGRWLIDHLWGGYLAVVADVSCPNAHVVLRDASGSFPAYHVETAGCSIYFDDVAVAIGLGLLDPLPDSVFAQHWLAYSGLRTARTGFTAVAELMPGSARAVIDGRTKSSALWSPWDHATPERQFDDFDEAAAALHDVVRHCTRLLADGTDRTVLELSGGLDSSIIAAALSPARADLSAMTFWTPAPDGDERSYARKTAALCRLPLAEISLDPLAFTSDAIVRPHGLRPGNHPALHAIDDAFGAHLHAVAARTLLTGTGGDNVFCYLTTAAPVVDAFCTFGLSRVTFSALADVADLNGTTLWTAARFAWRKARRRERTAGHWPLAGDFLAPDAVPERPDRHPWLDRPARALPGKVEHIEAIVRIQALLDVSARGVGRTVIHPLLTQPIVETCLRIPSWLWVTGGQNRAVARAAFADALAPEVRTRRGKGRLESICLPLYCAERRTWRDLLLGGWLAQNRIIDADAVDGFLGNDATPSDDRYFRIFELISIERWARGWLDSGS